MGVMGYRGIEALKRNAVLMLLAAIAIALLTFKSGEVPPLFFDEGWNLTVARNWMESGHYGPLLNAKPIPATMLSVGFPAIVPLAASFRTFGIGLWQARLPGTLFTAATMVLLCYIAHRLFGYRVATVTLAVLLLMPINPELHPVVMGRMAFGEMPALFYLLAGYAAFLASERRKWLRPFIVLFWGLALATKAQVIPFLTLALIVPLIIALYGRRWKTAKLILAGLLGSFLVLVLLTYGQRQLFHDSRPPQTHIGDWRVTIFVPEVSARMEALGWTLMFGLPELVGLFYAYVKFMRGNKKGRLSAHTDQVALSLMVFATGWLGWYLLLSIGNLRYLFPVIFVSAIFTSEMLCGLTSDFRPPPLRFNRQAAASLVAIALMVWAVPLTLHGLYRAYSSDAGDSVAQVAAFLNTQTPSNALIECGEAELFFLLNRRYNYGWDRFPISVSLAENPDYVVLGHMANLSKNDEAILAGGHLERVQQFNQYTVYRRKNQSGLFIKERFNPGFGRGRTPLPDAVGVARFDVRELLPP
jgi:4-amino-4-deoxy-L-arabinose transferase-like glycosyltransferase